MSGLLAIVQGQQSGSSPHSEAQNGLDMHSLSVPMKTDRLGENEEDDEEGKSSLSSRSPDPETQVKEDGAGHARDGGSEEADILQESNSPDSDADTRLLTAEKAVFELPVPLPMPPVLNMQYICETASRLLFLSVHWLKSITALSLR